MSYDESDESLDWYFQAMLLDLLEKLGIKQAVPRTTSEKFKRMLARPVSIDDLTTAP